MDSTLTSQRLELTPFEAQDASDLYAICSVSQTMAFIGPLHNTPDASYETIARFRGQWVLQGRGVYAIRREGELLGWAGVFHPPSFPCDELGYLVKLSAQSMGIGFEACNSVLSEWRRRTTSEALVSFIAPTNLPSIRLARKLGATRMGTWMVGSSKAEVYAHTESDLDWVADELQASSDGAPSNRLAQLARTKVRNALRRPS